MGDAKGESEGKLKSFMKTPGMAGWVLIAFFLLTVAAVIIVGIQRDLNHLESILLTILTTIFSILASALVSWRMSHEQSRSNYQQLARPALRRVLELDHSLGALREFVSVRRGRLADPGENHPEIHAWLEGIDGMIEQLKGQLRAGIDDWSELLPREVADYYASERLRALEEQRDEEQKRHEAELKRLQDQAKEWQAEVDRHMDRSKGLEKEISDLRRRLDDAKMKVTVGSVASPFEGVKIDPDSVLMTTNYVDRPPDSGSSGEGED